MLTMAVGHSDDVDPADAIAGVIEQCRAQLNERQARFRLEPRGKGEVQTSFLLGRAASPTP